MTLFSREKRQNRDRAAKVYRQIADQSRSPVFYRGWGVADTINGRFEMLALLLFAVVNRLVKADKPDERFAQLVMEAFVADMDRNYREIGISDVRVGKKIKAMYGLFGARLAHYDLVLAEAATAENGSSKQNFADAIDAHVFAMARQDGEAATSSAARLADYILSVIDVLAKTGLAAIRVGDIRFPEPGVRDIIAASPRSAGPDAGKGEADGT